MTFRSRLLKKTKETEASFLVSDVTMEEIKAAVWSCSGSKASGPDGLNFKFLKSYWGILQHDFFNCVSHFFQTSRLGKGCNACLYRQIFDGALIANEIVNHAKSVGLKLLLFMIDFEIAFDSVNWEFLLDIIKQMGFGYNGGVGLKDVDLQLQYQFL
ncbi:hypothetical protein Tco_1396822 [Tanacetum coccineum]